MDSTEMKTKLMAYFRFQKKYYKIATEVGRFKADFMASNGKRIVESEVKVSRQDLKREFLKRKHNIYNNIKIKNKNVPTHFYLAVTEDLIQLAFALVKNSKYGILLVSKYPQGLDRRKNPIYVKEIKEAHSLQKEVSLSLERKIILRCSSELVKIRLGWKPNFYDSVKTGGIYKIRNIKNGKVYIGKSKNIFARWENHKNSLKRNKHHNKDLQNDYNKFGKTAFKIKVLEYENNCKYLAKAEHKWADYYKAFKLGYNIATISTKQSFKKKRSCNFKGKNNPRYIKVEENKVKEILKLYKKDKLSIESIEDKISIGQGVIRRVLVENGIKIRGTFKFKINKKIFKHIWKESSSLEEVKRKYNKETFSDIKSILTIRKYGKEYKLEAFPTKHSGNKNGRYIEIDESLVKKLLDKKLSYSEIVNEYNRRKKTNISIVPITRVIKKLKGK